MRERLVSYWLARAPQITLPGSDVSELISKLRTSLNPAWFRARKIMGKNMCGVEEAVKHFGVNPSKRQLAYMSEIPFSVGTLEACKGTHILVAFFPNAILDVRAKTAGAKLPKDQKRLVCVVQPKSPAAVLPNSPATKK